MSKWFTAALSPGEWVQLTPEARPKLTGLSFAERLIEAARVRHERSHFGACMRCQMRWDTVEGHSTPYTKHRSCFPLCEECWAELTPHDRLPFYEALWGEWSINNVEDPEHGPNQWEQLKANVLAGL